jgi:hypothetical protein
MKWKSSTENTQISEEKYYWQERRELKWQKREREREREREGIEVI